MTTGLRLRKAVYCAYPTREANILDSLFTESIETLCLSDGSKLQIFRSILEKNPKLAELAHNPWGSSTIDIPLEVGHVVLYYLTYGQYQHLKPKGSSNEEQLRAEYATNIRVYAFCRRIDLLGLQLLAKLQIEHTAKQLPFTAISDQAQASYPEIDCNDEWFINFLESTVHAVPQNQLASWIDETNALKTLTISDVFLHYFFKRQYEKSCDDAPADGFTLIMPEIGGVDTPEELVASQSTQLAIDVLESNSSTGEILSSQGSVDAADRASLSPVNDSTSASPIKQIEALKLALGEQFAYKCIMAIPGKLP